MPVSGRELHGVSSGRSNLREHDPEMPPAITSRKVLAEAAGVSTVPLYECFPIKLDLSRATLRRHLDDVLSALRFAEEHVSPAGSSGGRASGMIALHAIYSSLH